MSVHKLNIIVRKYKNSAIFLYLILILQFIIPALNSSGFYKTSENPLLSQNIFLEEEVSFIIDQSQRFSSSNFNGSKIKNERDSNLIIFGSDKDNKNDFNSYFNFDTFLSYNDLPYLINFIPRSPPQILA